MPARTTPRRAGTNPTPKEYPMDIREPIAKMRAQAETNRKKATELEADAQAFWAQAQAQHAALIAQANTQKEEAAYWENLAASEEQKAGQPPLDLAREQAS